VAQPLAGLTRPTPIMDRAPDPWVTRVALLLALSGLYVVLGPVPLAGAVAVLLAVPVMDWLVARLPAETRASVARVLAIAWVPIAAVALLAVIVDWPAIRGGRPVGGLTLASLILLATAYVYAGWYPAAIAARAVSRTRWSAEPTTLWDLEQVTRRRRAVFRWLLLGITLALGGVVAGLAAIGGHTLFSSNADAWGLAAALVLLAGLWGLAWLRASGLGGVEWRGTDEPALIEAARRAVDGVAIAAGITSPDVRVVAHPRPTAFTTLRVSRPLITFTSGLVSSVPPAELEAVAAHEVGHLISGGVEESRTIDTALDLLRLEGSAALVLYLLVTGTAVGLPWALLAGALVAAALIDQTSREAEDDAARRLDASLLLISPAMVVANLLAYLFYYAVGEVEDLLADLRAVELTRHPAALHSALERLKAAPDPLPALPAAYHWRYFTGEAGLSGDLRPAQASIESRIALLERIDPALQTAPAPRARPLTCPDCGAALAPATIESHYGVPIPVDRCPACGGIWFDDLELYMAAGRRLAAAGHGPVNGHAAAGGTGAGSHQCPRCRVPLTRAPNQGMPADIAVFECSSCRGAWMRSADLVRFGEFRLRRSRRSTPRPAGRTSPTP
jgi:heat shock protein HtpX